MAGIYGITAGTDIPRTLVEGLIARHKKPHELAQVTLLVNSDRMAKAVRQSFIQNGPGLFPKISTVAQVHHLFLKGRFERAHSDIERIFTLFPLVQKFVQEPAGIFAGSSSFVMAQSLDALIREFHAEGIELGSIHDINPTQESAYWQNTTGFLSIVESYWRENGSIQTAEHIQHEQVQKIIENWRKHPPQEPIYIAGSTGSRALTRRLMQAVAAMPQGGVILPAYDPHLPQETWDYLSTAPNTQDHPQFRFAALLDLLGLSAADIKPWCHDAHPNGLRARALSVALRPAPVTHIWRHEGRSIGALEEAFSSVSLVQAENPEEEAQAIALASYDALSQGKSVAIVTPDRILSRRIAAYLAHWNITPDDSAGVPLHHSTPGRLVRHIARLISMGQSDTHLFEILKHPLVHAGSDRNNHLRLTRDLELDLRRAPTGPITPMLLQNWADAGAEERKPWVAWIIQVFLTDPTLRSASLETFVSRHLALLEEANKGSDPAAPFTLWKHEEGQNIAQIFETLQEGNFAGPMMEPSEYVNMVDVLLSRETQRSGQTQSHDIVIWGTQEARSVQTDVVILAGLNDGIWPALPEPDPWLNRAIRAQLGLFVPERQLGLSAHDFEHLANAPHVILTRATLDSDQQTVPSRWVNRLCNFLGGLNDALGDEFSVTLDGPATLAAMKSRGSVWRQAARDYFNAKPLSDAPARRPSPSPPIAARPKRLSITEIERLIRNPYEIYAKHVLGIRPLEAFDQSEFYLLRGTMLHALMEKCTQERITDPHRIMQLADRLLPLYLHHPKERLATRLGLESTIEHLSAFLQNSFASAEKSATEVKSILPLTAPEFELTGQIDRIDTLIGGGARIFDYKSSTLPSAPQQIKYNQQLLLSALMVEQGRLKDHENLNVEGAEFVSILKVAQQTAPLDQQPVEATRASLERLMGRYFEQETGYTARRAMFKRDDPSPYDHLSRYGEWDIVAMPEFKRVGPEDA